MTQIRHLMDYGTSAFDYFKTYYLGRAWLELALTEVQTRGYGFNFVSESGNAIVTENFNYESGLNYFSYTITGRHLTFQETVLTGNFLTLPLFYDDTWWKNKTHFQTLSWDNQTIQAYNFANDIGIFKVEWDNSNNTNTWLLMSLLVYDTWMTYMQDITQTTGANFDKITNRIKSSCMDGTTDSSCNTYRNQYLERGLAQQHRSFIMIKNTTDQPITFSWTDNSSNITTKEWITLLKSKVIVLAHYHDDEISMEAEYSKPVPAFFGATIGI